MEDYMPVNPATWEAEEEESVEPRRQRLQWTEIVPLHSSLGNKSETPSQHNNNNNNKTTDFQFRQNSLILEGVAS